MKSKVSIIYRPIESVIPYVNNSKIHSPEQVERLAASIAEFGFDQPIVVDKENIIIKGHGRRLAALALGLKEVPVVIASHLNKFQIKAARIADNKVSSNDYDLDLLKLDLGSLKSDKYDLKHAGISEFELDGLINELDIKDEFKEGGQSESTGEAPEEVFKPKRWSFTLSFENEEQFAFVVEKLKEQDEDDLALAVLKVLNYEG